MSRYDHHTSGEDFSEETVIPPKFDSQSEERAQRVVPLREHDEVTRVREPLARPNGTASRIHRGKLTLLIASVLVLLAASALAIQIGRNARGPILEKPGVAVSVETENASRDDQSSRRSRDNNDVRGVDGHQRDDRDEGKGEDEGEREKDREEEREKEFQKTLKKERERYRKQLKDAKKQYRRFLSDLKL